MSLEKKDVKGRKGVTIFKKTFVIMNRQENQRDIQLELKFETNRIESLIRHNKQ